MVSNLRARQPQAKLARRQAILDAVLQVWPQRSYPSLTMAELAQSLSLSKGTLYLYFPTKEDLFLSLYESLLSEWLAHVQTQLPHAHTPRSLAVWLAHSLAQRPQLCALVPLVPSILEYNISLERALQHKQWMLSQTLPVAQAIEQSLGNLPLGSGMQVLVVIHALVGGLHPMGCPSPAVQEAFTYPQLSLLQVHFEPTLAWALGAVLLGLSQTEPS